MVLPIQVFIQQETKKLDIFSLINLFLANFNLDQSGAAIQNVVVVALKERLKKPGVLAASMDLFASTEESYCLTGMHFAFRT